MSRFWQMGLAMLASLALAGCSLGTVAPTPTVLDLGAVEPTAAATTSVTTNATTTTTAAAAWRFEGLVLPPFNEWRTRDRDAVIWRTGAEGTPNRYATFRWRDAPATLVRERLAQRLSLHGPVLMQSINAELPQLQVTLMQFEQVFAADGSSNQGVVTMQAVLVQNGQVVDQFLATESAPGQAIDAPAGAQALRVATDRLIARLVQWLSGSLNSSQNTLN